MTDHIPPVNADVKTPHPKPPRAISYINSELMRMHEKCAEKMLTSLEGLLEKTEGKGLHKESGIRLVDEIEDEFIRGGNFEFYHPPFGPNARMVVPAAIQMRLEIARNIINENGSATVYVVNGSSPGIYEIYYEAISAKLAKANRLINLDPNISYNRERWERLVISIMKHEKCASELRGKHIPKTKQLNAIQEKLQVQTAEPDHPTQAEGSSRDRLGTSGLLAGLCP